MRGPTIEPRPWPLCLPCTLRPVAYLDLSHGCGGWVRVGTARNRYECACDCPPKTRRDLDPTAHRDRQE